MLAFLLVIYETDFNNTPHAFREICAPWGVTFFQGADYIVSSLLKELSRTPDKIVDFLKEGEYKKISTPAAPLLSMRNSVGFSFSWGFHGIS